MRLSRRWAMKVHKTKEVFGLDLLGGMAGSGWQGGKLGPGDSRTLKPDLELVDPMAIILLIPRAFMDLPAGGRMNPGRDHGAEKSEDNDRQYPTRSVE